MDLIREARMEKALTQSAILDRLHSEYERFQARLSCLTAEQMIHPQTIRAWSVKDLLAHLIAHEQRALQELRMALRGERLVIDHAAVDVFNDGAVVASRPYPLEAVRLAWQRSFEEVIAAVDGLPASYFDLSHPIALVLDDSIDGALANNTYDHYREHMADLELAIHHFHTDGSVRQRS
jgi:hypothetical protein